MAITVDDKLIAKPRANLPRALAIADQSDNPDRARRYVNRASETARRVGVDDAIVIAQSAHETANWDSPRWRDNGNPAGLGIVSDSTVDPMVLSPEEAADLHVWALCIAAKRSDLASKITPTSKASMFVNVWRTKYQSPKCPTVKTIDDLDIRYVDVDNDIKATWGFGHVEGDYAPKVVEKMRVMFGSLPDSSSEDPEMTFTFGKVVHPPYLDKTIPDWQNGAWDDLGACDPVGVVYHTMVGTLLGTDGWFRRGALSTGLTHYGIGGSADGNLDGVIYKWNDPMGRALATAPGVGGRVSPNRAGWANGGSDGIEGDGVNFVRKMGVAPINRNLVSIERSDGGIITTPPSEKQLDAMIRLGAYWFDYAKIPYDKFPLNPAFDIVTWLFHYEFATKGCPHAAVIELINVMQDRQRAILKAAQTSTPQDNDIPPIVKPDPDTKWPNKWKTEDLATRFGQVVRRWPDGQTKIQGFNPNGSISNAWVQRGAELGIRAIRMLPKPSEWIVLPMDRVKEITPEIVVFDAPGLKNWVLYRPDTSVSWKWVA